jgi:8-oxo-dGTP diphosphatase
MAEANRKATGRAAGGDMGSVAGRKTTSKATEKVAGRTDFEKPLTTVDVVIFTVLDGQLQVLLVRRPDGPAEPFPSAWALPGGFVDVKLDDSLEGCARRKLLDKTGVSSPYLEQLGSWGGKARDPRGWSATHAYFALLPADSVHLKQEDGKPAQWHPVNEWTPGKPLAFDHADILQAAVERLRGKVEYTSLPAFLLPEPFTLPQLQKMYEIVLGRPVDKSGFRTRALAAGFLDECGFMDVGSPRPAMGYRLKDRGVAVYFPRTFSPRSS